MKNRFIQFFYDNSQLKWMLDESESVFNPTCTHYFESKLLAEYQVPNVDAIGFASWDLKRTWGIYNGKRGNFNIKEAFKLIEEGVDFLSLSHRRSHVKLIKQGNEWHNPQNNLRFSRRDNPNMFKDLLRELCNAVDIPFKEPKWRVYEHSFVCKTDIFLEYQELLNRAILFVEGNPDYKNRLMVNSGYNKKLPVKAQNDMGLTFYPFTPFLFERLLSLFISTKIIKFEYW